MASLMNAFLKKSILLFFLFIPVSLHSNSLSELNSSILELNEENELNVLPYVEYLKNPSETIHYEEIFWNSNLEWKRIHKSEVFPIPHKQRVWLRFNLVNNFPEQLYILRIREYMISAINCFVVYENREIKHMRGGNSVPLDEKATPLFDSIFPIYLKSGERVQVFLELYSNYTTYTFIRIHSSSGFFNYLIKNNFAFGGYFGFISFMALLSFAIFIYLKDISYLYYFVFLIFHGLFQLSQNSYTTYFFYPKYPEANSFISYVLLIFSFFSAGLFARLFLNLKHFNATLDKVVFRSSFVLLLFIPLPYLISWNVIYLLGFLGISFILMIYPASIYVHLKKFSPAKYFIIAWGFLIIGTLVSIFSYRYEYLSEYASLVGSTIESIFIALAILSKANQTQREKESIQTKVSDYEKELKLAYEIQVSLLPKHPPKLNGVDIYAFFLPMVGVGGDYYDFHVKDKSFACFVADVSGHGPAAALISSMVKMSFKETFSIMDRPEQALRKMNARLYGNLGKQFVTGMYAYFDIKHKTLRYSSAGHPPILVHRRSEDKFIYLESKGQMLAYFQDIKLKEQVFQLFTGDRVILYSDGIIEAFNKNHEMFDYPELEKAIQTHQNFSAEEVCYYLIYKIKEWIGFDRGFQDDITVVVIDIL